MNKQNIFVGFALVLMVFSFIVVFRGGITGQVIHGEEKFPLVSSFLGNAVLYKTSSCGCCGLYAKYLEGQGFNFETSLKENLSELRRGLGVPPELESCHTMVIGDYFVEGHVPLEAIEKLLSENPKDIIGLAMSGVEGMPSGSPGMPGKKTETWIIYGVKKDGTYNEFMKI